MFRLAFSFANRELGTNVGRAISLSHKCATGAQSQDDSKRLVEQHGRFADFERALFRRLEQAGFKRSKRFYGFVVFGTVGLVAAYVYLFPHKLRQQVVEEVSSVASQSLEDEKIFTKAGQLSKDLLSDILNDQNSKTVASDFVKDIIVSQSIREASIGTILGLMNDPEVLELLRVRLSEIILNILQNESTRQIVLSQVNAILQHESIRKSLQVILKDLTEKPEVKAIMADFFRDVLSSDTVTKQGKLLGQQVTSDVISDKGIQEEAGKALWSAFKHSLTPTIFVSKATNSDDTGSNNDSSSNNSSAGTQSADSRIEKKTKDSPEAELKAHDGDVYNHYNRYNVEEN